MKNLKKLLPVFALVLGLGLVFTQSAFKSGTTAMYGKVIGVGTHDWEPLTGLTEFTGSDEDPLTENTYRCLASPSTTCTAEFDAPPVTDEVESAAISNGIFEFNR